MALAFSVAPARPSPTVESVDGPPVINGPVFNNPLGTPNEKRAVIDQLIRLINATQRGGEINLAMHEWKLQSATGGGGVSGEDVISALERAARERGVRVKLVLNWKMPANQEIRDRLGPLADVTICPDKRGCIAGEPPVSEEYPPYLHNKFAVFSNVLVNGVTYAGVVFQSSSNLHDWYVNNSYNDAYTLGYTSTSTGSAEEKIYAEYRHYFTALQAGAQQATGRNHYWQTASSGKYRVAFYPHRAATSASDDPIVAVLNKINGCIYSGPNNTKTTTSLHFALTSWTDNRLAIADKLQALARQGCSITVVIAGPDEIGVKVKAKLTAVPIALRECRITGDIIPHTKITMINGPYGGKVTQRVITGSANFTQLPRTDDAELEITDSATYDLYAKWYEKLLLACPTPSK
jgi:phosphatidylserine/phosphatidylglycerophosphate/cardiolipin synthase-like enzyme